MVNTFSVSDKYKRQNYLNSSCNTVIPPLYCKQTCQHKVAKADSGASKHYFTQRDKVTLTSIQAVLNGPQVNVPNRTTVQASESCIISLHSSLSTMVQKVHVFPSLTSASLFSIGQLCDDGCTAILNNKTLTIYIDGLWDIDLTAHAKIFDTHSPNQTTEKIMQSYAETKPN